MKTATFKQLDVFKPELVKGARFSPVHEFPLLEPVHSKPDQAIPFEKAYRATDSSRWVHFYTHDRNFERVWNTPKRYLPMFRRFAGIITPDFSLYREMPLAMQIWNTYRNRALSFWMQREGIPIVPNVRWGDERTYAFAFEGLPQGGTVAVSTVGSLRKKVDREFFKAGLARMVDVLQPETIVNYGHAPDEVFGEYVDRDLEVIVIPHYSATFKNEVM